MGSNRHVSSLGRVVTGQEQGFILRKHPEERRLTTEFTEARRSEKNRGGAGNVVPLLRDSIPGASLPEEATESGHFAPSYSSERTVFGV
jgi:hypothetical protein